MNFTKILLGVFCVATLSAPASAGPAPNEKKFKARWVTAHNYKQTKDPLAKVLNSFTDRVREKTKGRVEIELIYLENNITERHLAGRKMVFDGEADFGQMALEAFRPYSPKFWLFNVPFLFNSHEDVRKAIDGQPGQVLKDELFEKTDGTLRLMEFTYSGGYRVIWGDRPVNSVADLSGARFSYIFPRNPRRRLFEAAGAVFSDTNANLSSEETVMMHGSSKIDLEENEVNRLYLLSESYPEAWTAPMKLDGLAA